MALLDDILSEIIDMDNEERKNLLVYLRQGRYTDMIMEHEEVNIDGMDFLKGLSSDTLAYVKLVLENYKLNLYHSAAAIIQGQHGYTLQEKFDYYMNKYQNRRPWMKGNERIIKEIFNHVCRRLGRKDLLPRNTLNLVK